MADREEEARVRRTLQDMKIQLEQNIASRLQTQYKKQTIVFEGSSDRLSAPIPKAASVSPKSSPNFRRSRVKRVTLTGIGQGKLGGKGGPGGVKRLELRRRAHYPWRQMPERFNRRTSFWTRKRTKVRGEAAKRVHIPFLFRLCSNPYVQFGGEICLCVLCYTYFLVTTYQAFFDLHNPATTRLILVLDFVFLMNFLVRLLIECWRYMLALEYTVLFIPCTPRFWIISLVTFAPMDYIMTLLLGDSLTDLQRLDQLKWNRWLLPVYVQVFYCKTQEWIL